MYYLNGISFYYLQRAINNTAVSADIDDAEGCLDALMQVVVCEDVSNIQLCDMNIFIASY